MHENSMKLMRSLLEKYAGDRFEIEELVLDVGSRDVNGSYRELMPKAWSYTGADIRPGKNVDVVVTPGNWIGPDAYSIVISGQTIEHVENPFDFVYDISSVLLPDGLVIIIAPWKWEIHRYPEDCWRILPDGMRHLLEYAELEVLEVGISENDCFGVGRA